MSGDDSWAADDDGADAEEDGDRFRGWIHPDDRLWRHPSEGPRSHPRGASGVPLPHVVPVGGASGAAAGRLGRRGVAPWLICGSLCVALAVAAIAVVVADTSDGGTSASTELVPMGRSVPTTEPGVPGGEGLVRLESALAGVRPSTVALRVAGPDGVSTVIGVVAEAGGIVVTAARAVDGARRVSVVEPDGTRDAAVLVGVDRATDLAVLRVPDDLPVAGFDVDDPSTGSVAMAVSLRPRPKAVPVPLVYAGTVTSSGDSVSGDAVTATFASTSVHTPLGRDDIGCPLVDASGHVVGMLELVTGSGDGRTAVFLPSALIAGVARQLVSSGAVDHGWLGIGETGSGAPSHATSIANAVSPSGSQGGGALITTVARGSPAAAAGLAGGDVVVAVDGAPVHSTAELLTRLYPDPPGTSVALTFRRAEATTTVEVQLSDDDDESSVASSS